MPRKGKDRGAARRKRNEQKLKQKTLLNENNNKEVEASFENTDTTNSKEIESREEIIEETIEPEIIENSLKEETKEEIQELETPEKEPIIPTKLSEEISFEDKPLNLSPEEVNTLQTLQDKAKPKKIKKSKKERGLTPEQIELQRSIKEAKAEKQYYQKRTKEIEEAFSSKKYELNNREEKIKENEDLLEQKEKELEDNYNNKNTLLENEYLEKETNLKKYFEDIQKEQEQEIQRNKDLFESYKEKTSKDIEDKINKTTKSLEKMEEDKKRELQEEKNLFEQEKIDFLNDLDKKKETLEIEHKNREKEFEDYKEDEYKKLDNKRKEVEEYKEFITKKVDEQIEDKRQAFIDEMIYMDSDYREEMDRREWQVALREQEFEKKAKEKETQILQSVNEYSEKVDKFNKEVDKFNEDKIKFLKEHHYLHILSRKIKEHLYPVIIGLVLITSLIFLIAYSNEYKLFKGSFIASSINKFINTKVNSADYEFELDTKNSVLTKFTTLDGLTIDVNTMKNRAFSEDYDKVIINSGDENFVYERYYKDRYMVLKSALFGQYVEFDDIEKNGLSFTEDEFNNTFFDSFKKMLSKRGNNKYSNVAKINVTETSTFFDFLNSTFFARGNYEYFYTIENEDVDFFKDTLMSILETDNYKNFIDEESLISAKLKESNSLTSMEEIIRGLIENTVSSKNEINLKISENEELSDIDITFNIEYKDVTMASSVPMKVTIRCSLEDIKEDTTLKNPKFEINPVKFENMITK